MIILAVLFSIALPAAAQDYFPLAVGYQWVYRGGGTRSGAALVREIVRAGEFAGRTYYLLRDSQRGEFWLREDDAGSVFAYDPGRDEEKLWYSFASDDTFSTAVPGNCCGRAQVVSRAAKYRGPVGEFTYALEIYYLGVFQVGLARELFLPWIGMIHRYEATGGPSVGWWDLVYSRTGSTVVSEREVTFSLALDRAAYEAGQEMFARLALRVTQDEPLRLVFPSGQIYDLVIRNESGDIVYQWSAGRVFIAVRQELDFGPGERNWAIQVRPNLPPGRYKAEAFLAAQPRVYSASLAFEIR